MSAKMAFRALAGATIYVAITTIAGCGGSAGGSDTSKILSTGETKQIVKELPYAFSFRSVPLPEGATGAVAGRAVNKRGVVIRFGISLGRHPKAVPVQHADPSGAYGYPRAGFVYTDDATIRNARGQRVVNGRFRTDAEYHEALDINVAIQESLCKAATGEPCPI